MRARVALVPGSGCDVQAGDQQFSQAALTVDVNPRLLRRGAPGAEGGERRPRHRHDDVRPSRGISLDGASATVLPGRHLNSEHHPGPVTSTMAERSAGAPTDLAQVRPSPLTIWLAAVHAAAVPGSPGSPVAMRRSCSCTQMSKQRIRTTTPRAAPSRQGLAPPVPGRGARSPAGRVARRWPAELGADLAGLFAAPGLDGDLRVAAEQVPGMGFGVPVDVDGGQRFAEQILPMPTTWATMSPLVHPGSTLAAYHCSAVSDSAVAAKPSTALAQAATSSG